MKDILFRTGLLLVEGAATGFVFTLGARAATKLVKAVIGDDDKKAEPVEVVNQPKDHPEEL